jgi:hypothetical protein
MARAVRTQVVASLAEFTPQEWDRLLPAGAFYGSYAWSRAVQRHEEFSVRYVAARDGAGNLVAALPVYLAAAPPRERQFDPSAIFGPAGDGDPAAAYPAAVVGVRAGYSTCFPLGPADAVGRAGDTDAVLAALLGRCADEARAAGARSLSLLYLPDGVLAAVSRALPGTAMVRPAGADAVLRLRWDSFEDYLGGWTRNRRRGIARDLAAFAGSGCEVSRGSFAGCHEEMAPLLAALQTRHGAMDSLPVIRRRLAEQADLLDDRAVCFVCRKGSEMVGFSLFYEWDGELFARVVGFDYQKLPEDSRAYFSVLFYEPIRFAISRQITAIHYGRGTADAKVRRGAVLEPRWSVLADLRRPAITAEESDARAD